MATNPDGSDLKQGHGCDFKQEDESALIQKEDKKPANECLKPEHGSDIKQEDDLEEEQGNIIKQETELAVIQEEEKKPAKESLKQEHGSDIKQENDLEEEQGNIIKQETDMKEMEMFYKEKLKKADAALKQKEEELKSFKQRQAAAIAVSLKTGDTESMNNPVSKTRLIEMYDNLRLLQWAKTKDQLKSRNVTPDLTCAIIKITFGAAVGEIKKKMQQIEEMFGLTESNSELAPQKVKEYRQLTVQNLQMALFHSSKEDLLKTGFLEHGISYLEDVMVDLRALTSECYWLGCLMALNNPPLQPDWKNHVHSMDQWDIFPRDIKPFVI